MYFHLIISRKIQFQHDYYKVGIYAYAKNLYSILIADNLFENTTKSGFLFNFYFKSLKEISDFLDLLKLFFLKEIGQTEREFNIYNGDLIIRINCDVIQIVTNCSSFHFLRNKNNNINKQNIIFTEELINKISSFDNSKLPSLESLLTDSYAPIRKIVKKALKVTEN